MIGLALSGGGSRAIAFHLGCFRALKDLGILDDVKVLSTISGGSVIGALYAYSPDKTFEQFEEEIRLVLRKGFQLHVLLELLKPHHLVACSLSFVISCVQEPFALFANREPAIPRFMSRTNMLQKVLSKRLFSDLTMKSPRRNDMEIVIGACEIRTGSAFRFGQAISGSWRYGVVEDNDIDLAFAVSASAAHPIYFPALDRDLTFFNKQAKRKCRVSLTDGGVYDNLGVQVLEPGRNPNVSLHTYSCDYLIVCNAGEGAMSERRIPTGYVSRVKRSSEIIHRRVQDSSMGRLHRLRAQGLIKGFVLPYLGQQDNRLPWKPAQLVPRNEVIDYPTNFCAMSDQWINKLSTRGEQMTRALVSYYLPELISR